MRRVTRIPSQSNTTPRLFPNRSSCSKPADHTAARLVKMQNPNSARAPTSLGAPSTRLPGPGWQSVEGVLSLGPASLSLGSVSLTAYLCCLCRMSLHPAASFAALRCASLRRAGARPKVPLEKKGFAPPSLRALRACRRSRRPLASRRHASGSPLSGAGLAFASVSITGKTFASSFWTTRDPEKSKSSGSSSFSFWASSSLLFAASSWCKCCRCAADSTLLSGRDIDGSGLGVPATCSFRSAEPNQGSNPRMQTQRRQCRRDGLRLDVRSLTSDSLSRPQSRLQPFHPFPSGASVGLSDTCCAAYLFAASVLCRASHCSLEVRSLHNPYHSAHVFDAAKGKSRKIHTMLRHRLQSFLSSS